MQEIEVHVTIKGIDAATLVRLLTAAQGQGGEAAIATRPVKSAPVKVIEAEKVEASEEDDSTTDITKGKKKTRGPYKKKKDPEPEPEEEDEVEEDESDESEDEESDESDSDDEDEGEDEDEDEGRAPKKSKKSKSKSESSVTLDDVLAAFSAFTKKHDRDKAAKVLKKFDVKMIRKAPEELWPKLIEALKV